MARQLELIETPKDWQIAEETREIGRKGIARARQVLAEHGVQVNRRSAA